MSAERDKVAAREIVAIPCGWCGSHAAVSPDDDGPLVECLNDGCLFYDILYQMPPADWNALMERMSTLSAARLAGAEEMRERCALLHEQVDVSDGREPMAVVIQYRDMIRAMPL
jgi:hypothetical protein